MHLLLLAILGGAIGAGARQLVNVGALRLLGPSFPWATATVNVVGSFAMGLVAEWVIRRAGGSPELKTFLATGILGGFTTFSAFSMDTVQLIGRGETALAVAYVLASVMLSIAALYAGLALARWAFA